MSYESPRFIVHGSIESLTLAAPPSDPQGNDPCRFNNPRDVHKQTGTSDFILGSASLATCTPSSGYTPSSA